MSTPQKTECRIACFISNLDGGGAERVAVNLLQSLPKGMQLDLILAEASGPYISQVPAQVRVIDLGVGRVSKAVVPLSRYLRAYRPDALLSHSTHANVAATAAKALSRTHTRLVLVEHNTFSAVDHGPSQNVRQRLLPIFTKVFYKGADEIVGVSTGVSRDLERSLGMPLNRVRTVYNPVVNNYLRAKSREPVEHPWFDEELPIFLAVGRLSEQKDFATLLRAFASLRRRVRARLIILGEGKDRAELECLRDTLGLSQDVAMPGFVLNPYAYMRGANALVLSSRWEGLPTVLIEAMACGCPVVATDCPSGSREILEDGRWGPLVPIGDADALAQAMLGVLQNPIAAEALMNRAEAFSSEAAAANYLNILLPTSAQGRTNP